MNLDETIKHTEEIAKLNRDEYAKYGGELQLQCAEYHEQLAKWLKELKQLRKKTRWIPITTRPMEEDEKPWHESCYDGAKILDCPLPEDGEDVLITVNGITWIDTFIRDETDGCYFESYDIEEVKAWKRLPEPYKAESEV